MAYYRFTRLQQYINGQPTDVYSKGERVDDVDYDTYDGCMDGTTNTRWIPVSQTVCYNGDLWSMEKEQISYDEGAAWTDTGNTRRASVIEQSSSQCSGANNDWRVVYGEYICNGTTKCVKEAEYVNDSPTGRTRAGSMVELLSEDCGVMHQWVDVPGEFICVYKCGRADKYTKQKQQYSIDGGLHWEDTGETREGDFIEKNSADCGCDTSITRWITVSGEYVCAGTSKYTKEKEQTSTDGTNWTDTGNTRAGSLIEASSSSCASTRWVTVSGQYSCVGTDKYNLEKEQSSTDGTNWTDTGNTRAGSTLIEANSTDCGYVPPSITRWINVTGEYVCVGTDKYNKEKEQISYDSGNTWTDTGNTKAGSTLIEHNSEDCPSMTCCELFETFGKRCWPQPVLQETVHTRCIQDSTDGSTNYKSGYSFYARKHTTNYGLTYYTSEDYHYYLITDNGNYSGSIYNDTQAQQTFNEEDKNSEGEIVSTISPIAYDENIYTVNIVGLKDDEQAPSVSNIAFTWSRFGRDGWYLASTDTFFSSTSSVTKKDNSTITAECTTGDWRYTCDINPVTKVVSNVKAYRWSEDTGYACTGYDKYNKEKEQLSTDGGTTWTDTGVTRAGSTLIETNSTDCSRWVADTGYMCVGIDKYNKEKEQISYDGGTTWTDTGNTRAGSTLIEANSADCGYVPPSPYSTEYLTTEALSSGEIRLRKGGYSPSMKPITNIQYSKNDGAWTSYTYSTNISVVTGDKIRWKGTRYNGNSTDYFSYFAATANYNVYGNPLSLLNNDNFINNTDAIYDYAYYGLFRNSTTLKDASGIALPATTLAKYCYYYMFEGCTSLTTAPALPATTMVNSCYRDMFNGCTGLTTAPVLPATTMADSCYREMFYNCNNLNNVTCLATNISASYATFSWLGNVSSTGTFTKAAGVTWSRNSDGIPSGWTVQDAS